MPYADSNDKRTAQRRWERTRRKPRDRSAYQANRRKTIDPNLRTQREDEQRFRFLEPERLYRSRGPSEDAIEVLHTIHTRETLTVPEFVFQPPVGRWKFERVLSSKGLEEWGERWASRLKLSRAVQEARS
jgi:hypothetical protein